MSVGVAAVAVGSVFSTISFLLFVAYSIWILPSLTSRAVQLRRPLAYFFGHICLLTHVLCIGIALALGYSVSCTTVNVIALLVFTGFMTTFYARLMALHIQIMLRKEAGMTMSLDDHVKSPSGASKSSAVASKLFKYKDRLFAIQIGVSILYFVARFIIPLIYIIVNSPKLETAWGIDTDACRSQWMIVCFIGFGFFLLVDTPIFFAFIYTEKEAYQKLQDSNFVKDELKMSTYNFLWIFISGIMFTFVWFGPLNSMILFLTFVAFIPFVVNLGISYHFLRKSWGGAKSQPAAQLSKINAGGDGVDDRELCLNLLKDEQVRPRFEEFLKSEHAVENLLFWKEVEDLREVSKGDTGGQNVAAKMIGIYKLYMDQSSSNCVNISAELQKDITSKINTLYDGPGNIPEMSKLFDDAQYEIVTLLVTNFLGRFKQILNTELGSYQLRRSKSN